MWVLYPMQGDPGTGFQKMIHEFLIGRVDEHGVEFPKVRGLGDNIRSDLSEVTQVSVQPLLRWSSHYNQHQLLGHRRGGGEAVQKSVPCHRMAWT